MSKDFKSSVWTPEELTRLRELAKQRKTPTQIARELKKTKNQIIGIMRRQGIIQESDAAHKRREERNIKPPSPRLNQVDYSVITRITNDKSRITLKHIPSIEQWEQGTGYSYTSRDRSSDMKK